MAWIHVRKAYDSVHHGWLRQIMRVQRFSDWMCEVVSKLCAYWNTRVVTKTKSGSERSELTCFNTGLSQGDALCPRLFTLCLNPVAWKLSSSEGYKLSKPISSKVTNLLYVNDLKGAMSAKERVRCQNSIVFNTWLSLSRSFRNLQRRLQANWFR